MKNKYQLPHPVRMRVIWLVRDYERLKREYDNAIWDSPEPSDGQPRGNNCGDPTEREGLKRAELSKDLEAIEQAFNAIPEEYQQGVWDNVVYRARYPMDAGIATYKRHRGKFLYRVAKNLFWV